MVTHFIPLVFVSYLSTALFTHLSGPCGKREFKDAPVQAVNTCDRNNKGTIKKRWRGELSIRNHGTYVEIEWKKIVQDHRCVRAMEFFVDGEKEKDIWGAQRL